MIASRNGIPCMLECLAIGPWIPMRREDVGETGKFMPDTIHQLQIADGYGSRDYKVKTTWALGADWKPRGKPTTETA